MPLIDVIRCKDCKHQRRAWNVDKRHTAGGYHTYWCDRNQNPFVSHTVNGYDYEYCSSAERKEQK